MREGEVRFPDSRHQGRMVYEKTLRATWVAVAMGTLLHCSSEQSAGTSAGDGSAGAPGAPDASTGTGGTAESGGSPGATGGTSGNGSGGAAPGGGGGPQTYPDVFDPPGSPIVGEPGCGFATAAFCDTFDGPGTTRGRGGELDASFWSAGRSQGQLSTTRAMGIGMAVIPACRPGVSNHVWPNEDTLVCDATVDIASDHLLIAVAAQNYGQNGYRIRQPFDFSGRTGKIVVDATADPLSPLRGWMSFAITEDPISVPGYSILGNDEGSIIPRNAIEVHFVNAPGSTGDEMSLRNVHVFRNYVDTVHAPAELPRTPYRRGKMNRFEILVSEQGIDVSVSPFSEDGVTFAAPAFTYHVDASIPFSRGYVHVSAHNHATIKYTGAQDGFPEIVDATIAQVDNVGFDGPVITTWREYEVADALGRFTDPVLGDPHNVDNVGYDLAYVMNDVADGPRQVLTLPGVDLTNVASARLAFSVWIDFGQGTREDYAVRVRLNGGEWLERKLSTEEIAMLTDGPTTVDSSGAPVGDPASQGRLALTLDVPLEDLVTGDNTVEFVTAAIPTGYPPLVHNIDLVMETK